LNTGDETQLVDWYIDAVLEEISSMQPLQKELQRPLRTVYFGGGTPSLCSPFQIGQIINALNTTFGIAERNNEITLEADPGTFSKVSMMNYLKAGINRVSLGVQSFNETTLKNAGRFHSRSDAKEACSIMRSMVRKGGISGWSIDLISGLPGVDLEEWKETLKEAVDEGVSSDAEFFWWLNID